MPRSELDYSLTILEGNMELHILRPEPKWTFPCLGIHRYDGLKVCFTSAGNGVVVGVDIKEEYELYETSDVFDMSQFKPLKTADTFHLPKEVNWDVAEVPFAATSQEYPGLLIIRDITDKPMAIKFDNIFKEGLEASYRLLARSKKFSDREDRDEFLGQLEILPKGTVISIKL